MGTWGTGIFEDDTAGDVRDAFEDELSAGADVATAAKRVLDKFRYDLDDSDDGPVIYLTLAALQLQHQGLQPDIRERALQIIDKGEGLDAWEAGDPLTLQERKQVLEGLRAQLTQ